MIRAGLAGALLVLTALAGCATAPPEAPVRLAEELPGKVTVDAMVAHLQHLQTIADEHDGNRADGTTGFQASVDYIAKLLGDNGFDVSTPEFERLDTLSPGHPTLTVSGRTFEVDQASLLVPTPAGGTAGPVLKPTKPAGCTPADYPTAPGSQLKNAIAVVDDTDCSVLDKQDAAIARGAVALVVISAGGRNGSPPQLFPRGYYNGLRIPVAVAGNEAGAALRRTASPVRLVLDAKTVKVLSRNVLAQTKTGSTNDIILVGAHLDSVDNGPGINDNGSGVAAVLETALQLGAAAPLTNAVRFAFWGAEEQGLAGSLDYLYALSRDELNAIALYLNFDMIGSENAGFFTYDGDQSGPANVPSVPIGSAGIERTLAGYLNLAGKRPADLPLSQRTDYQGFLTAGVPIGGFTTGSEALKTKVQARLWGGTAGQPFDPNYHRASDTLDNINRAALAVTGPGVAFAVGSYAQSIEGVNGVPGHDKRHRAALGP